MHLCSDHIFHLSLLSYFQVSIYPQSLNFCARIVTCCHLLTFSPPESISCTAARLRLYNYKSHYATAWCTAPTSFRLLSKMVPYPVRPQWLSQVSHLTSLLLTCHFHYFPVKLTCSHLRASAKGNAPLLQSYLFHISKSLLMCDPHIEAITNIPLKYYILLLSVQIFSFLQSLTVHDCKSLYRGVCKICMSHYNVRSVQGSTGY